LFIVFGFPYVYLSPGNAPVPRCHTNLPEGENHDEQVQPAPGPVVAPKQAAAIGADANPELDGEKCRVDMLNDPEISLFLG